MNHPETIKEIASQHFGIELGLLSAKTRKREVVIARQSAMVAIIEFTNLTLKTVGAYFGNRDHSTVLHAKDAVQDMLDTDYQFARSFTHFRELVMDKLGIKPEFDESIDEELNHLIPVPTNIISEIENILKD